MVAPVMNNTTNASFIPTIISQEALGRFASYMNLAKTVSRNFDWTPATYGSIISVPKRGTVTANSFSAGGSVSVQNPTATNVNVTLNQHYESTIAIDNVTQVLENQDVMVGYAEDMAIAIAEAVEQSITALHPSITNTVSWDRTSGTTIDSSMLKVRKFFTDQKVPQLEQKYLYLDSTVYNDLLATDKFARWDAIGQVSQQILAGKTPTIYNFNIFESQNIQYTGSPGTYHSFAYTRDGFLLATRPLPDVPDGYGAKSEVVNDDDIQVGLRVIHSFDPNILKMQLTIDVLWGVTVLDTRRVLEVEST